MKAAMRKINGKNNSSARVVDGKLILSYPNAINPIVWQMDLTQAKASALEVRENTKAGVATYILTLKTVKGETVEVAPFAEKSEAVAALMAAAHAMENAHGQIRPFGSPANEAGIAPGAAHHKGNKWIPRILGLLLILALIGLWSFNAPRAPRSIDTTDATGSGAKPNFAGTDEPGVPLSADEFLMRRQK